MTLTLKLLSWSNDSTKMPFLPAIKPPIIRERIVTPHTRLRPSETLTAAYANMLWNWFCKVTLTFVNEMKIPLYNITPHDKVIIVNYFSNYEKLYFFHYISTHTCHRSYFLKHLVVQGNTEAAHQKCLIKEAIQKKVHKKSPAQSFSFRARGYWIFTVSIRKFSEQLRSDKIVFKERRFC